MRKTRAVAGVRWTRAVSYRIFPVFQKLMSLKCSANIFRRLFVHALAYISCLAEHGIMDGCSTLPGRGGPGCPMHLGCAMEYGPHHWYLKGSVVSVLIVLLPASPSTKIRPWKLGKQKQHRHNYRTNGDSTEEPSHQFFFGALNQCKFPIKPWNPPRYRNPGSMKLSQLSPEKKREIRGRSKGWTKIEFGIYTCINYTRIPYTINIL